MIGEDHDVFFSTLVKLSPQAISTPNPLDALANIQTKVLTSESLRILCDERKKPASAIIFWHTLPCL